MVLRPYDGDLQKQFRDVLRTPAAPEVFDDSIPVQPVAIVATTTQSITMTPPNLTTSQTKVAKCLNHSFGGAGIYTFYTPTTGKTLYISALTIATNGAAALKFGDNVSNALVADTSYEGMLSRVGAADHIELSFPIPLKISTALNLYASGAVDVHMGFSGWEE